MRLQIWFVFCLHLFCMFYFKLFITILFVLYLSILNASDGCLIKTQSNCSNCHEEPKLPDICKQKENCISCHNPDSLNKAYLNEEIIEKYIKNYKNPHKSKNLCNICHHSTKDFKLKYGGDDIVLCEQCHLGGKTSIEAHSVNFTYHQNGEVTIPEDFPLSNGKVTCLTCHKFDCNKFQNPKFLRKSFTAREDFCFNCHKRSHYSKYNPHTQIKQNGEIDYNTCVVCHSKIPDIKTDHGIFSVKLKGEPNRVCNGCHQINYVHPTGVLHTIIPSENTLSNIKKYIQNNPGLEMPFGKNFEILCVTCHLPHQFELIPSQSKGKNAKRVRFPSEFELCVVCHDKN